MSEYNLQEVPPTRSVSATTFASGLLDFPMSIGAPNAWIPSKSYFRIEMTLSSDTAGAVAPVIANQIAFADNVCGNLFNNVLFKMGGLDACAVTSYQAQCSALSTRMGHTNAWLSSVGKDAMGLDSSFASRVLAVSSDNDSNNIGAATNEDITFRPVTATNYAAAEASITAAGATANESAFTVAAGAFDAGTGSPVGGVQEGDTLVFQGGRYTVIAVTNSTVVQIRPRVTANVVTSAATANWYFIRRFTTASNQAKNKIYVCWQPPVGIMAHGGALGAGDYRFSLNPDPNFRLTGVETFSPDFATPASSYTLSINSMNFYACTVKMSIPEGPSSLTMMEMLALSKPYSTSLQFSVPASTLMLTLFAQSTSAGSAPSYPPSKFKTPGTGGLSGDTSLQSIQITYANINKPPTRWVSTFTASPTVTAVVTPTSTNELQQRYLDSYYDAQMIGVDDEKEKPGQLGGVETFSQWVQRGPFFTYVFMKDSSSRATEVLVNVQYSDAAVTNGTTNIFLVAWYRRTVDYTVAQGMVTQLATRDV